MADIKGKLHAVEQKAAAEIRTGLRAAIAAHPVSWVVAAFIAGAAMAIGLGL